MNDEILKEGRWAKERKYMKEWKNVLTFICLLMFIIGYQSVEAQQNLAQQAYAIFEQNCLNCHGEHGAYTEQLIIEHAALVAPGGAVIPGNPQASAFYQRLIETAPEKRMPLNAPPLSQAAIDTIQDWILAGAPDWRDTFEVEGTFITPKEMLETIENHVNSLAPFDRTFARYFTLTHLYNAGETTEALLAYRRALSKLVNSLSWGRKISNPRPIDSEETIYYIDLRDYEWEIGINRWTLIEAEYPYGIEFNAPTQTGLREKLTNLREAMDCEVPFVHVDWFLATASLPPLYHDILGLPETDRELETRLEVNVVENLRNAAGRRVWRAGFNESGVSNHNRVLERHESRYGAYWKSYDFAGSVGSQNIFTHPLSFTHDGGEIIFNLPNGLQAYLLVDAGGNRLNTAPISIVRNPAASDPTVRNGLSCIGCHTEGMKVFEDEVRGVVEQNTNPPFDKDHVLRLYVEKVEMDSLVAEDTERYRQALEETSGVFGGIEPIQRFHEAFQGPVDAAHAAAAVGLETEAFLQNIHQNTSLQHLGLLVLESGTMKRDTWTEQFSEVVFALDFPSLKPSIVDPQEEIIPGATVHIPDVNLREAIAKALGKLPGIPITVEEMATLERLRAWEMGISDLTGLEFATNLDTLLIGGSLMPDLSSIAGLTQLSHLRIPRSKISDISPLTELKNLGALEIYDNEISDISPLAGLTNLHWLSMYNNPVSDLSPLANLKHLRGMRVSVEGSGDLSPIAELINLEDLFYWGSGNPIPDLSPLTNLPKLRFIDIRGSGEPDLSPLAKVDTLERFEFWGSGEIIPNLSPLAESINLKELWVINCGIIDLTFLENFTALERLNLERNNISDVSPLAGLTNLKWLKLTNNPISDFSSLEVLSQNANILTGEVAITDPNLRAVIAEALGKGGTTVVSITAKEMTTLTKFVANDRGIQDLTGLEYAINLEDLYAPDNQITDLSPLSELINLRVLNVWNNPIESLSPIAGLSNLEHITLVGDGGISDISPLAGLVKLRLFLTWGNPISDLSPLSGLTQLEILDICGSEASDISPLAKLTGLTELYLSNNGISDVSPLSGLTSLTRLVLENNEISDVSPLAALTQLKWLRLDHNSISDFSSLAGLSETTVSRTFNPGAPTGGPKIEGPWLWVTVPGERLDRTTDRLAEASEGIVTEQHIATTGAREGTSVGNSLWTAGEISPLQRETNIIEMLDSLGIETDSNNNDLIIYGSITLDSPRKQDTKMFVGSGDRVKVWLNGELVHQVLVWRRAYDYQDYFPVTLKRGTNVLLVAVDKGPGYGWSGFFGFEEGTEYMVSNPRVGYNFSESTIHVSDTFTLDISAEDIYDLAGWQFDIVFDSTVLEAVEVNEGDFLKTGGEATFFQKGTIDNTTGKITKLSSARLSEDGVSSTGTLLSVTFTAKTAGQTQLKLENLQLAAITGVSIPAGPHEVVITVEGQLATGDVNRDGQVSILDMVLVARHFGKTVPVNSEIDMNGDGVINIQDLIIVAQHLGESTVSAAPSMIAEELNPAMIQAWIAQAQVESDGSIAFQQGIANLQRLLALLIPEKTALLPNYPNPFNPETWIPYQLAEPGEVTLTIYAVNGTKVRTLALGLMPAGIYQSRSRAAYWDGKNDVGESVASGVYFYTLTAGEFTSTRKMLIRK